MNLAAQAKDPGFFLYWIPTGLVKVGSPSFLPVFQRLAANILFDSPCWQDAIKGFHLAVRGCTKLNAELPPWLMERNPANEAWRIIRDILYEHFKNVSAPSVMDQLWLTLRAEAPCGAAEALFLMRSTFVGEFGDAGSTANLIDRYPTHVKAVMEHSLQNLPKLTSAWKFGQSSDHLRERAEFVISVLGQLGDRYAVEILKGFTNDPALGKVAIAAIKSIKACAG